MQTTFYQGCPSKKKCIKVGYTYTSFKKVFKSLKQWIISSRMIKTYMVRENFVFDFIQYMDDILTNLCHYAEQCS